MKALIDDQVRRLSSYGNHIDLRVEAWHGDVSASRKHATLRNPPAVLMITPESLQSLLIRKPANLLRALAPLRYVVIDEVHALAGTDRGQQLQSLLHQIEVKLGRRVPRIALSATVSEPRAVTAYLRPGDPHAAQVVAAPTGGLDLDVELYGVHRGKPRMHRRDIPAESVDLRVSDVAYADRLAIAQRIDSDSRGYEPSSSPAVATVLSSWSRFCATER